MSREKYNPPDYFALEDLLTEEQQLVRDSVREWVDKEVLPIIDQACHDAKFPEHLIQGLGEIGAFGATLPVEYGGADLGHVSNGLIMQELERGDSGIRSVVSVQSSLAMNAIYKFGNEEQKMKLLPPMANGKMTGCFGLTEPDHGSDPSGMITNLKQKNGELILNGAKMWITNAPIADVAVVWAKDEEDEVVGVILERGMEGFTTPETKGKWSLRASPTGELVFDNVVIPEDNILKKAVGIKAAFQCLNEARYGIAWGALGVAMDCYDSALQYAQERTQFGKPIAAFQLTQKKLAEMVTEITKGQLMVHRLGTLKDEGKSNPKQISMTKRNNVEMALNVAREARQIHGAMGISGEFPLMRHMMNLESVITYEGTHDIHLLITGEDITGIPAFE